MPRCGALVLLLCATARAQPLTQRMSTKTAYAPPENATTTPLPAECAGAVMLNIVARHGSRHRQRLHALFALASAVGRQQHRLLHTKELLEVTVDLALRQRCLI